MEKILEAAKKKAEHAEVFRIDKRSEPTCFYAGKLSALECEISSSIALRVISNGRLGFSSTTSLQDVDGLVDRAVESARFGPESTLNLPGTQKHFGREDYYDPAIESVTTRKMIDTGKEMLDIVYTEFPEVNLDVEVTRETNRIEIMNSSGGHVSYEKSIYQAFLNVLLTLDSDRAELEHTCSSTRFNQAPQQMARDAVWRFKQCSRVADIQSKRMTVVFTSLGFRGLFVPLFYGFNGELVGRGLSLLTGKIGEKIIDPRLSIYDDPTIPELPGSCPVDDEGVPAVRKTLVEKGTLLNCIYDLQSAAKYNAAATGNGFKKASLYTGFSVDAQPNPILSNLIIPSGEIGKDALIKDIREGIIVDDTIGAGQGNNLNGEFSMNVALGYKIENGEIVGRVKDVMVAGNVFSILKENFRAATRETWSEDTLFGRYQVPWIAFDDMPVSAT